MFCRRQALAEFEMYRQRMEDSQLCTEAQHTQRVVSMSREVRTDTPHLHLVPQAATPRFVFVLASGSLLKTVWNSRPHSEVWLFSVGADFANFTSVLGKFPSSQKGFITGRQ